MDFNELKKPFPRHCISWRVGATSGDKSKAIGLAYIDARDAMQRLDEVCGIGGWQCSYPHANGKTSCRIGINVGGEWVWKENGCGDSQVEAEKGAFSDAFKRAAVLWGIGRYLYDVPNVWVEIEPMGKSYKFKNPSDPKLLKALETAEKGIRVEGEPEPEVKIPTPEQQKAIDWLGQAKRELGAVTTYESITRWQSENTENMKTLSVPQVEWLDKEIKKNLNRLNTLNAG